MNDLKLDERVSVYSNCLQKYFFGYVIELTNDKFVKVKLDNDGEFFMPKESLKSEEL